MIKILKCIENNKNDFFSFINLLLQQDKGLLILGDIEAAFRSFQSIHSELRNDLCDLVKLIQEAVRHNNSMYLDFRPRIGYSEFYIVNNEELLIEKISIKDYLKAKEKFVNHNNTNEILSLNFKPFYDKYPLVRDVKSIGAGVEYLNRYLSSQMFTDIDKWREILFNFIKLHKHENQQLILNDRIEDAEHLLSHIKKALKELAEHDKKVSFNKIKHVLQDLGFEIGLGKNAGEITKTLTILDSLMNSPDHISLKEFLSRIPMIFNIAVVSPHGYFAQENVLGLPDSGGQIVYILDQVKALEKSLINSLKSAGLNILPKIIILTRLIPNAGNTKCNNRLEKVLDTKNTWILRVPFREHNPKVTNNWISRFEIWPYLEEFADDSFIELQAEFKGNPDLIIGNYSDGNLVSHLLSKKFGVTQCCIAHALEKSKYLFSALYWDRMEDQYNFSTQFTADLIAMNTSDFQITSTYQEIAGTEYTVGQYESHKHFTLPGLYRVENGIDLYHTKFNIISPGVNEKIFFPNTKAESRINDLTDSLTKMIYGNDDDPEVVGKLLKPELTPIFSIARFDKNKNLSSLVRWFAESSELQELSNLIIVGGKIDVDHSSDKEEAEEIITIWNLINEFGLHDKIRWIGKHLRKPEAGEVYRIIADRKGVFVQPGLFEGFGLTVLEAMICGVPVIATKYGGPLEIIENNINGFHIDPINSEESKKIILDVVSKISNDKLYWEKLSSNSIKRVNENYNWKLYSKKLLTLSKMYGFWKYLSDIKMKDLDAYIDVIYHLLFKPRAKQLLEKHNKM